MRSRRAGTSPVPWLFGGTTSTRQGEKAFDVALHSARSWPRSSTPKAWRCTYRRVSPRVQRKRPTTPMTSGVLLCCRPCRRRRRGSRSVIDETLASGDHAISLMVRSRAGMADRSTGQRKVEGLVSGRRHRPTAAELALNRERRDRDHETLPVSGFERDARPPASAMIPFTAGDRFKIRSGG